MEIHEHIAHLEREGAALAAAAERHGLDARLPTCPGWDEAELLRHTGGIQRWATRTVAGALRGPIDEPLERIAGGYPPDGELLAWFRHGLANLVSTLRAADPALACFTFLVAPSPLAFWARRQAQEVVMHRVDAESPGGTCAPIDTALAVDGVDEMLFAFTSRPRRRSLSGRSFTLRATDADRTWHVRLGPRGVVSTLGDAPADAHVTASASVLYRFVWNRADRAELSIGGDATALDEWRDHVHVRWED